MILMITMIVILYQDDDADPGLEVEAPSYLPG